MIATTMMMTTGRRHGYGDSDVMNKVMRDDVRAFFNDSCPIAEQKNNKQDGTPAGLFIQVEKSAITDY